eukprot:GHUV01000929.1.p1 GENE.GHUV01000929.1~~GHUV01000929.1.p1  ORF type:complete len:294 (+),score=54.77 GHUV01000929.1:362-1243(+)
MIHVCRGLAVLVCMAGLAYGQQGNMSAIPGDMPMDMSLNMTSATATAVPDSCVSDPTQANCTDYVYPRTNAAADLATLCKAMPFMVACSAAKACNATGASAANVSKADVNICEPFQLVATVCRPQENMMRMKGCVNYNPMCANGTQVQQCSKMPGVEALPTTKIVNDRVRSICDAMPHGGCELCLPSWQKNQTWGDCDLLDVYGSVCSEMPDMTECAEFQEMCTQDASLWVCRKYPTAIVEATAGTARMNDTATRSVAPNITQVAANTSAAGLVTVVNAVALLLPAVLVFVGF